MLGRTVNWRLPSGCTWGVVTSTPGALLVCPVQAPVDAIMNELLEVSWVDDVETTTTRTFDTALRAVPWKLTGLKTFRTRGGVEKDFA